MARLTTLKPSLDSLTPRLGYLPGDEKARNRQRYTLSPWRAWYASKEWARLRHQCFIRDSYTCQRTGVLCIGKHPAPNSPVAHHKTPHRGDPKLFWSIDNLQTVSKEFHDSVIQAEERHHPTGG